MHQQSADSQSQRQDNLVQDTEVRGDLIFAPVEVGTKIETQIVQVSAAKVTQQPLIKSSPYQGLKRFNLKDRDRFFGRDQLIARLFEAVNRSSFSLVLGASGSGKSSVVRAGLIPELKKSLELNKFYDFIFTPHEDPFESLYWCLLSEEKDYSFRESQAKIARKAEADTLTEVINTLKKEDERWLIFVDQFEELFTSCEDVDKRNYFIESLVRVAHSGDNSVKIILAMRADFLEQLSSYPALGAIANDNNIHLVTDMHPDELRQTIEQPVARHGVVFEEGLVQQIIAEVEGQKGYLPLLQYTLDLLWQIECRTVGTDGRLNLEDRTLNKTSYAALKGVRGALQKRVNEIYNHLNQDEQSATEQIFVKLVNIVDTESGSKTVARRANRSEFVGELVQNTLQTFIDENLLVSSAEDLRAEKLQVIDSESSKPSATVEMAHEILLSSWDQLKHWIEQEKEAIILKTWLTSETKRWQKMRIKDQSKAKEELLKGSRLEQVIELRKKDAFQNIGGLRTEENEFIDASVAETERLEKEKEARRQRDLKTAWRIAVGSLVALIITTGLGLRALYQRKRAELNLADSLARSSLYLFNQGKELDAFVEAIRAGKILQKQQATNPAVISALQVALNKGRERNRLQGHDDWVMSVSFSPDGKVLASGSGDKSIKLWNLETGSEIGTLQGHDDLVYSVSFSPDGKVLASGSGDKSIKLWNLETGEEIRTLQGHDDLVYSVSFSPDGKVLASGSGDKSIKLWNLEIGSEIATLQGHDDLVYSVSFSPDGKVLASGSGDKSIKLWNLETGSEIGTLQGHDDLVYSVSFSPDGKVLASGSGDKSIKLWNLETGSEIATLQGHDGSVYSVSFSPDGTVLASGSGDKSIKLWNLETGSEIATLQGHNDWVRSVSFSPVREASSEGFGKVLASGSGDKSIKLWNLETGSEIATLQGHDDWVYSVSFSPDGKVLASGSRDKSIKLWNLETGSEIATLQGHDGSVHSVSFSPVREASSEGFGKVLASGSGDKSIKLWNLETGSEIATLQGHDNWVISVSFSPVREASSEGFGKTLASGSGDKSIKLWNLETGTEIATLQGHDDLVYSVSFSPDSKTLASGSRDKSIKLWNLETGSEIDSLQGHDDLVYSVSFSPDGKVLASGSRDKSIKLWNLKTGSEIATLQGHDSWVMSVSFSPDSKVLASGGWDKTIKLWNLETGSEIGTLYGHDDSVSSVSFSPDGKTLASGSVDKTIKLWNLETRWDLETLMGRSCDWVRNYLQYNPNVSEEDRHLCDGIGTQQ
jgi:WD40 repeat protein